MDIADDVLDPMNYDTINKIIIEDKHFYSISKEGILYNRALDYTYQDNKTSSIYLMANSPDDIDFEQIKEDLRHTDKEALEAFEEWMRIALED